MAGLAQLLIWGSWLFVILWGSIMAVRGARNWATILQVVGAGGMLAGMVGTVIGAIFTMTTFSRGLGSGPTPSSMASSGASWMILLSVGTILLMLGVILFTAGYVGMCAKYGATERRARELEVLVSQMQERIQSRG